MEETRFGPSGNGAAFYDAGFKSSVDAPKWLKSIGLNAYEYSFGRGFTMGFDKAELLGKAGNENSVLISVHAPYYINFANPSDEMFERSLKYVLTSFEYLRHFGGKHVVVHIGTNGKLTREEALALVRRRIPKCVEMLKTNGFGDCKMCIETMGKYTQIGTYEEIVDLCEIDDMLIPCFDFGHINCIEQGGLKSSEDFERILSYAIGKLGYEKIDNCHIHFSKIMFSEKGEIKHLDFDDHFYGPEFEPLAHALKKLNLHPHIICESATKMSEDARIMKGIYESTQIL